MCDSCDCWQVPLLVCLCVCCALLWCCSLLQERVFELGERVSVLSQVGQPALVPHMAEAAGQKLPYEVGGRVG